MEHGNKIHDSDSRFVINPITRLMKNESNKKTTIQQYDHNSERFTFELPRYIEGHDMAECNKVQVHYINTDAKGTEKASGLYESSDLAIDPNNEEAVICSWLISRNATQIVGSLDFIVRYCCEVDGVIAYSWNTAVSKVAVSTGIDASGMFEDEYLDVIEQWKADVIKSFNTDLAIWKEETEKGLESWQESTEEGLEGWKAKTADNLTEWKEAEQGEIRQLFGDYTDHWQNQIEAERARIDSFVALEEGSTTGDAELIDARIAADGTVHGSVGTAVRTQIEHIESIHRAYMTEEFAVEYGAVGADGTFVQNVIRCRTEHIPIRHEYAGQTEILHFIVPESMVPMKIVCFENGNFYKDFGDNFKILSNRVTFPNDGGFDSVVLSFARTDNAEISQDELDVIRVFHVCDTNEHKKTAKQHTENLKEHKGRIESNENEISAIKESMNPYKGKKYVALGDSITYGFIPRNAVGYPGQLNSFAKLTADHFEMRFDNQGISGSSVAYVPGRSPMCERVAQLADDADVITFMGGTNDIRNGVQLGNMADRSNETFFGALHIVMGTLYEKYYINRLADGKEAAKVIVCTPIKLLDAGSSSTQGEGKLINLESWVNAVKEVANYYGFPVVDFYNTAAINPHLSRTIKGTEEGYTGYYNPYITDGTHPTQDGASLMASVLIKHIEKL